ncbi:MAG: hypothetical protein J7J70_09770, partial [Deltaproteobacteria bacterium]|nr:hypothetical protein [Candidatus Tharpellaceae bacterium]
LTLFINYFLYAFLSNAGDENTTFSFFFCRIMKIYVKKIQNSMRLEKTINHIYLWLIFFLDSVSSTE